MIRVAVADDRSAAVETREVLTGARKAPRQKDTSLRRIGQRAQGQPRIGIAIEGARASDRRSVYLQPKEYARFEDRR
jgi:hypothetical protein